MYKGVATKEKTFCYIKRFPKYSRDFFIYSHDRFFSTLGLGTFKPEPYREDNYIVNFKDAIIEAVSNGINYIDTASNYRYGISEQEIKEALDILLETKGFQREELVISSKAGFIPLDFPFPEDPYSWIEEKVVQKGLATKEEVVIDQHCMNPKFLRWSVERSLSNLGIETLDLLFLHNPETQLGYVPRKIVLERIKEAFILFESLVKEGKIKHYGVASWNTFLYEEDHTEYLSLMDIVAIAKEVGGEAHHFKYLQLPYNLAKTHALNYTNQPYSDGKYYSIMQVAAMEDLHVIGSASLLQMNLFKKPFTQNISAILGTAAMTDVHTALQFARSGPVVSALFGSLTPDHVKDNLFLAFTPKANPNEYRSLFMQGDVNAL
ncbi:MAG: aldo/keto reductase [Epsilonproteobacteria bacterium]|nr:aldo/keto reductase [Campylobacterota bacterium]